MLDLTALTPTQQPALHLPGGETLSKASLWTPREKVAGGGSSQAV